MVVAVGVGKDSSGARGVYEGLRAGGVDFAVSIPDSVLYPVDTLLRNDPDVASFVCSREDEGIAMSVGGYLAGANPVALMEGSGIGYSGLILARAQIQRTPLLILASHNKVLGERFDYHGATRLAGQGVLDGLGIPHLVVFDPATTRHVVEQALVTVRGQKTVVGLFFPPYVFTEQVP